MFIVFTSASCKCEPLVLFLTRTAATMMMIIIMVVMTIAIMVVMKTMMTVAITMMVTIHEHLRGHDHHDGYDSGHDAAALADDAHDVVDAAMVMVLMCTGVGHDSFKNVNVCLQDDG